LVESGVITQEWVNSYLESSKQQGQNDNSSSTEPNSQDNN